MFNTNSLDLKKATVSGSAIKDPAQPKMLFLFTVLGLRIC